MNFVIKKILVFCISTENNENNNNAGIRVEPLVINLRRKSINTERTQNYFILFTFD